jgi:hypothetical protein
VLCDLILRPSRAGAAHAARRLLRSVGPGMLVLGDRGLHSFALLHATGARRAEVLGRVGPAIVLQPAELLRDGSVLAFVSPSPPPRRRRQAGSPVRGLASAIDAPPHPGRAPRARLIPALVDPARSPAATLAAEYHQRGEVESTADALQVHQAARRPAPHLRPPPPARRPAHAVHCPAQAPPPRQPAQAASDRRHPPHPLGPLN